MGRSRQRKSARKRVGNVSYYQHHGSWYIYYLDGKRQARRRVAGDEETAAKLAVDRAEDALLDHLAKVLIARPKWVEQSLASMRSRIEEAAHHIPEQMKLDERRCRELGSQIANLVDAIAAGTLSSHTLQSRLVEAERDEEQIHRRLKDAQRLLDAP